MDGMEKIRNIYKKQIKIARQKGDEEMIRRYTDLDRAAKFLLLSVYGWMGTSFSRVFKISLSVILYLFCLL